MARRRGSGGVGPAMRSPAFLGAQPSRAAGSYPSKGAGLGEFGSTAYPTVLESYNRNSDYRRWKLGQEYYFGAGRSWADVEVASLSRRVGAAPGDEVGVLTTQFPSSTSPERSWQVSCRPRGAIVIPEPLEAIKVSANTSSPDLSAHTVVVQLGGSVSVHQLELYRACIGDPFEDTATGTARYDDLVKRPSGSIALTLAEVDTLLRRLYFDASRPAGRVERGGRIYWSSLEYDPADPIPWALDGSRHLCSSFKFFCSCPDHIGGSIAGLDQQDGVSGSDRFPLPNAARDGALRDPLTAPISDINSSVVGPPSPFESERKPLPEWEQQGSGFYKQWRTLPRRRDRRRDCKHIHALRWECGVPWLEPSDYPTSEERQFLEATAEIERGYSPEQLMQYFRQRQRQRRFLYAVADACSISLYPPGDPRNGFRPDERPILWNDPVDPSGPGCRINDWWLKRGTGELRIFNGASGRFEDTVTIGGVEYPVVEFVERGSAGAPRIVV